MRIVDSGFLNSIEQATSYKYMKEATVIRLYIISKTVNIYICNG